GSAGRWAARTEPEPGHRHRRECRLERYHCLRRLAGWQPRRSAAGAGACVVQRADGAGGAGPAAATGLAGAMAGDTLRPGRQRADPAGAVPYAVQRHGRAAVLALAATTGAATGALVA